MEHRNEDREAFLRKAGEMYDRLVAQRSQSTGESFDDIEVQARRSAVELARTMIENRLKAEAQAQTQPVLCPRCGRPMRRPKKAAPRNLETPTGTIAYARHHAICDHCGESFSPSGPSAEDPPPGQLGSS